MRTGNYIRILNLWVKGEAMSDNWVQQAQDPTDRIVTALERLADTFCPTPSESSNEWYVWIETWEENGNPSYTLRLQVHGDTAETAVEDAFGMLKLVPGCRVGDVYAARKEGVTVIERWRVQETPDWQLR